MLRETLRNLFFYWMQILEKPNDYLATITPCSLLTLPCFSSQHSLTLRETVGKAGNRQYMRHGALARWMEEASTCLVFMPLTGNSPWQFPLDSGLSNVFCSHWNQKQKECSERKKSVLVWSDLCKKKKLPFCVKVLRINFMWQAGSRHIV